MTTLLSFIFVFSMIVISHELGHFFFARKAGIKVLELGLGIGPRVFKFVKNNILYTLNALPLGGFIKIAGINPEAESADEKYSKEESYLNKRPLQKFLTIIGGSSANIILALLIFVVIFSAIGIPSGVSNEISGISAGSEAEKIGLMPGDAILRVNGKEVTDMSESVKVIHGSAGKTVVLDVERGGKVIRFRAVPRLNESLNIGLVGFSLKTRYARSNIFVSVIEAFKQTIGLMFMFIYILGMLFTGGISLAEVSGPVGIAQYTGQAASGGIVSLLYFTAFLSINLGVLNLLPIPALDGGRLVFIVIEAIRRKPVDIKLENKIHQIGITLLLGLFMLVTVNDIVKLIR